jgi:hypothetical protein
LVTLGVATTILAAIRHQSIIRQLDRGESIGSSRLGLIFAAIMAGMGFAMAIYLLVAQHAD